MKHVKIEPVAGGHSVRLRYGKDRRDRFKIPILDRDAAQRRADAMASMARELWRLPDAEHERSRGILARAAGADADELKSLRSIVAKLTAGKGRAAPEPQASGVTFRKLSEQWTSHELHRKYPDQVKIKRSVDDDVSRFRVLNEIIGDVPIALFTLEDAERAMRELPERARTPATRRQYAQLISKLLKLAVYPLKLRESSPLPVGFLPKATTNKAKAWLYPDEDALLLACRAVPLERRVLFGFLAREGMRLGEALKLQWGDLDLGRGTVRLDENKSDDPRAWALDPEVARALKAFRPTGAEPGDRVFPLGIDSSAAAREFREHLKAAGVDRRELFEASKTRLRVRVHDLRGTFVTLSLANGKTEAWVTDRTGHKSSAMIYRYKRAARQASELNLGALLPLDTALPELWGPYATEEETTRYRGAVDSATEPALGGLTSRGGTESGTEPLKRGRGTGSQMVENAEKSRSGGMADAADSKSAEVTPRVSSSLTFGTRSSRPTLAAPRGRNEAADRTPTTGSRAQPMRGTVPWARQTSTTSSSS